MQRRELHAPDSPPIATYYSQVVEVSGASRTLYISGQVGVDARGKIAEDFPTQCRQTLLNLQAQLRAAGMSFDNVVKLLTILPDLANIGELRRIHNLKGYRMRNAPKPDIEKLRREVKGPDA